MAIEFTKLGVFNSALGHLEQEPVASAEDTSSKAAVMRQYYETALQTTLESHAWDFATKFATLGLISGADNLSPYQYLYGKPSECVKISRVYDADDEDVDYILTKDGLYCDASPAYCQYVEFTDDYSLFTAHFVELLSFRLAELSAERILGSTQARDFLGQEHNKKQAIAASHSVGKSRGRAILNSDWVNVRYL